MKLDESVEFYFLWYNCCKWFSFETVQLYHVSIMLCLDCYNYFLPYVWLLLFVCEVPSSCKVDELFNYLDGTLFLVCITKFRYKMSWTAFTNFVVLLGFGAYTYKWCRKRLLFLKRMLKVNVYEFKWISHKLCRTCLSLRVCIKRFI